MADLHPIILPYRDCVEYTRDAVKDCLAQTLPVRLLLIDNGSGEDGRVLGEELAGDEDRVRRWRHDPPLLSLSATWNRALQWAWESGADHALVINNDVRLHPSTYAHLLDVALTYSAYFVTATGVTQPQFDAFCQSCCTPTEVDEEIWNVPGADLHGANPLPGPDFSCFLITKECHEKYPFDTGYTPAFCVTPDTLVLMRDLSWVPIGHLHPGDQIIGVDETGDKHPVTQWWRRNYRHAMVISTQRRLAKCVRIILADGRETVCSTDHKWLAKYPPPNNRPYQWLPTTILTEGFRIATPLDTWAAPTTYEEGWLAGIIDGEGTLRQSGRVRFAVNIAQNEGLIFDQVQRVLDAFRIPWTARVHTKGGKVMNLEIGIRKHVLHLLGQIRPTRLLQKVNVDGLSTFSKVQGATAMRIQRIEPVGRREVVTLETTSLTYIANGMIAHNCEDLDFHRRMMLEGDGQRIFGTGLPYLHYGSQTIKSLNDDARKKLSQRIDQGSRAHHRAKWGGDANAERFTRPFDPTSAREGVTTADLFERVRNGQEAL